MLNKKSSHSVTLRHIIDIIFTFNGTKVNMIFMIGKASKFVFNPKALKIGDIPRVRIECP